MVPAAHQGVEFLVCADAGGCDSGQNNDKIGPVDRLDPQQIARNVIQHRIFVLYFHIVSYREAETVVTAEVAQGYDGGGAVGGLDPDDREHSRTVVARPFKARCAASHRITRRIEIAGVDFYAVELILGSAISRIRRDRARIGAAAGG